MRNKTVLTALFTIAFILIISCNNKNEKPVVAYINSYHIGQPSSDEITLAIGEAFPADSFRLHTWYMDSKRNQSEEYISKTVGSLLDSLDRVQPDILIVSDDNAVKFLVEPHVESFNFPVVFCGVNFSADQYSLPRENVTGMIEILPVRALMLKLQTTIPDMKTLFILNENTNTAKKEQLLLDTLYTNLDIDAEYSLVDDFESWKAEFIRGNEYFDAVFIPTNGAIADWDKEEAVAFSKSQTKVPVVTIEDFMMPYSVYGLTKISAEQGEWASSAAKKILNGASPANIPYTENTQFKEWGDL